MKKKVLKPLLCSKTFTYFMEVQSRLLLAVKCSLLRGCGQKWAQPFRSYKPKIISYVYMYIYIYIYIYTCRNADTNVGKTSVNLIIIEWVCPWDSNIRCISQMSWWIEQIGWFFLADCDWIIFGLTTNLLSIFDICWMFTVVVLVKNVLHLVPTGKVLELGCPKCF